jgi:L-cysteine S-thiosulfotransferase
VRTLILSSFALALMATAHAKDTRKSGFDFMQPATQALQKDDAQNPAMLWVNDGQSLWNKPASAAAKACANCHGEITRMRGVATRYPAYSSAQKKVLNLSQQINVCRAELQRAAPWPPEHESLLGLEAAIAKESRDLPIKPRAHPQLAQAQKRGEALFNQRIGQVDLSCRDCHDTLPGKKLGGNTIPQGHATGYPIYRLEWQSVGSLQRRLRGCMTAVRAEPFAFGATELVDLEAYLAKRAAGMPLESPGVRP